MDRVDCRVVECVGCVVASHAHVCMHACILPPHHVGIPLNPLWSVVSIVACLLATCCLVLGWAVDTCVICTVHGVGPCAGSRNPSGCCTAG